MLQSLRRHHKNNADRDKKSIKKGFFFFFTKSHLILKVEKNSTNQKPSTRNKSTEKWQTAPQYVPPSIPVSFTGQVSQRAQKHTAICSYVRDTHEKKTEANVS